MKKAFFLIFFFSGGIDRYDDFHENYSVEIPDRFSNKSLTLKLIWVEGIYPFGQCNSGGLNSTFKGADPLSDLVIIDAGSWTLAVQFPLILLDFDFENNKKSSLILCLSLYLSLFFFFF